jgi:hypothetical protein
MVSYPYDEGWKWLGAVCFVFFGGLLEAVLAHHIRPRPVAFSRDSNEIFLVIIGSRPAVA